VQAFRGRMASVRLYLWLALVLAAISEQLLFALPPQSELPKIGHGYLETAGSKDMPRLLSTESLLSHTGLSVSSYMQSMRRSAANPCLQNSTTVYARRSDQTEPGQELHLDKDLVRQAGLTGSIRRLDSMESASRRPLDLKSAGALIRAPRLFTTITRPESLSRSHAEISRHKYLRLAAAIELDHGVVSTSIPDSTTSSASPLPKSHVSGRRTLIGMSAGLATVCFIFMVWM